MQNEWFGYDVKDVNGTRVGDVDALWVDETTGRPEFVGVSTGAIFGRHHIVPVARARVDPAAGEIRVPFPEDVITSAPDFGKDEDLDDAQERDVYAHFDVLPARAGAPPPAAAAGIEREAGRAAEDVEIPLREERLRVGKETVPAGGVRLRKVVRTETVDRPVELRREEIEVERVPPGEAARGDATVLDEPFREGEVVMRAESERPVVQKDTVVTGGVRAEKHVDTTREEVEAPLRKEDVEVDRERDLP